MGCHFRVDVFGAGMAYLKRCFRQRNSGILVSFVMFIIPPPKKKKKHQPELNYKSPTIDFHPKKSAQITIIPKPEVRGFLEEFPYYHHHLG